jgi:hypothetical protein
MTNICTEVFKMHRTFLKELRNLKEFTRSEDEMDT